MFVTFTHISAFLMDTQYSLVYYSLFIHSTVDRFLGGFWFGDVINNTAISTHVNIYVHFCLVHP